jgi:hypothetical protein
MVLGWVADLSYQTHAYRLGDLFRDASYAALERAIFDPPSSGSLPQAGTG